MPPSNSSSHQVGGIVAQLASGVVVAQRDCADWNTPQFFKQATAEDVDHCISEGSDLEARDKSGRTPLHVAMAFSENPAGVKALIDAGADLEARDNNGLSPSTWR